MARASPAKKPARRMAAKPKAIRMSAVVQFVNALNDQGVAKDFVKAADKAKAVIALRGSSAEFVRKFLSKLAEQSEPASVAGAAKRGSPARRRGDFVDPCPKGFTCFD